jgi:hypothetical protein
MATNNDKFEISELDFDSIKTNLISYLKSQDTFKDFDFEGSGIQQIINLLAYNTNYNSYYLNMVANEMFLDSADLRDSVVSRAKALGYVPRSAQAPRATVYFEVNVGTDTPGSVTIPAKTKVKTKIDNKVYYFSLRESIQATFNRLDSDNNRIYKSDNVLIYEGSPLRQQYIVDVNNVDQRFIIPNQGVDTQLLGVTVQRSPTNTLTDKYEPVTNITNINGETNAFFIQEIPGGLYEVYFGDGNIGKALSHNNVVIIDYINTNGPEANKASLFTTTGTVGAGYDFRCFTVDKASSGADRESTQSIKLLAPLHYDTQNRAVTANDYKTLLLENYGNIDAVSTWGGEDNNPPVYGKVFISLKPKDDFIISDSVKQQIIDSVIGTKNIVSITPEIIDPDYIYLGITSEVNYARELTTKSAEDLRGIVRSSIVSYFDTYLNTFQKYLRYSRFTRSLDDSDPAIVGSETKITMKKIIEPNFGVATTYTFAFNNEISNPHEGHTGAVLSEEFTYGNQTECYIADDGTGALHIFKVIGQTITTVVADIGTVDYDSGTVIVNNFAPVAMADEGATLVMTTVPANQNIYVVRNQIISIREEDILLSIIDETTAYETATALAQAQTTTGASGTSGTGTSST